MITQTPATCSTHAATPVTVTASNVARIVRRRRAARLAGVQSAVPPVRNRAEDAHRFLVTLETMCLPVVITAQPHGNQHRGPEGHDRHVDQTRHMNER